MRKWFALFWTISLLFSLLAAAAPGQQQQQATAPAGQWEAEIKRYEEADRAEPPSPGAVLFVGSSSIRLWKELAADFAGTKVINRGFGGSQIADSTFYAGRIVVPYRPRLVIFYAGDNDIAQGKTPERVFADFREFVGRVRRDLPETRIAFISIKPSPARWHLVSQVRAANEMIRRFIAGDQKLAYIDVFTPMLGVDGQPRPELYVSDKLHMTRQGYEIWRKTIGPYLK